MKKITIIISCVSLVLSVACTASPEAIATRVAIAANATVASWTATATPYPTSTPFPTATPYPTATAVPAASTPVPPTPTPIPLSQIALQTSDLASDFKMTETITSTQEVDVADFYSVSFGWSTTGIGNVIRVFKSEALAADFFQNDTKSASPTSRIEIPKLGDEAIASKSEVLGIKIVMIAWRYKQTYLFLRIASQQDYTSQETVNEATRLAQQIDARLRKSVSLSPTSMPMQVAPPRGDWVATTDWGKLGLTVDSTGTTITKVSYEFIKWTCGPVTNSGTISASAKWTITDGKFSIESRLDPNNNQVMTINGTLDETNQKISGTWTELSYGSTCSGTWEAIAPSPSSTVVATPGSGSTPPPTTKANTITPTVAPVSFAIKDDNFAASYKGDCDTDAEITSVSGSSFQVDGTVSMRNGQFTLWCYGAKHTWMGKLTYAGYTFASDDNDPLQFRVDKDKGYLYIKGKGTVTMPGKTSVTLPSTNSGNLTVTPEATPSAIPAVGAAQLVVTHSPNPAKFQAGGASNMAYTCGYKTSVKAIGGNVRIEGFGMYFWENGQWVRSDSNNGKPFSSDDFANWYSCPGAYIQAGKEFSDPSNWNGSDSPAAMKGKWFYIGVDDSGRQVQGESEIECQSP